MAIAVHDMLNRLQRMDNLPMNIIKQLPSLFITPSSLKITAQVFHRPLSSVGGIIFIAVFLNANISEMNKHVIKLTDISVVFHGTKSTKPKFIKVALEWSIRRYQNINSKIELLSTNQKRVINVPRYDIGIPRHGVRGYARATITRPPFDLGQPVD